MIQPEAETPLPAFPSDAEVSWAERNLDSAQVFRRVDAKAILRRDKEAGEAWTRNNPAAKRFRASMAAHADFFKKYGGAALERISGRRMEQKRRAEAAQRKAVAEMLATLPARFVPTSEDGMPLEGDNGEKLSMSPRNRDSKRRQPLPCQSDNISPYPSGSRLSNNTSYRRKRAFEVETNILAAAEKAGIERCLEFTVTIDPGQYLDRKPTAKDFGKAWDYFNRKWLANQPWRGPWVAVKEIHKSGIMHAHIFMVSPWRVWRSDGPPKFRKDRGGKTVVMGASVAPWVPKVWKQLREGALEKHGLGVRHSLQPIKGKEQFAKYIAKYLVKGFKDERPEALKHIRLVNYSQDFARCCRAIRTYDAHERPLRIGWDKKKEAQAVEEGGYQDTGDFRRNGKPDERKRCRVWRKETETSFSFLSPSGSERRVNMAETAKVLGVSDYDEFKKRWGPRWAWWLNPVFALYPRHIEENAEDRDGKLRLMARTRGITTYSNFRAYWIYRDKEGSRIMSQERLDALDGVLPENVEFAYWEGKISGKRYDSTEIVPLLEREFTFHLSRAFGKEAEMRN